MRGCVDGWVNDCTHDYAIARTHMHVGLDALTQALETRHLSRNKTLRHRRRFNVTIRR